MPDLSLVRPLPEGLPWPSKPTLLHGLSAADYHADLIGEVPTASRSCLHTLLTVSPRHAKAEHPRLPGERAEKTSPAMSTGSLVHALLLGGEESLAIVEAENFRTKEAQAKRDAALETGLTPICRPEHDAVRALVGRLQGEILDVLADLAGVPFLAWRELAREVTCLWEEWNDVRGLDGAPLLRRTRCRARLDLALIEYGIILDLKTVTKGYAVAETFIRQMNSEQSSLPMQAAFYQRGFEAVHPELAGRTRFIFLRAEIKPPFTVLAIEAGSSIRQLGEDRLNRALPAWARCMESSVWPGPSPMVAQAESWAIERELQRMAEQELEGGDDEA